MVTMSEVGYGRIASEPLPENYDDIPYTAERNNAFDEGASAGLDTDGVIPRELTKEQRKRLWWRNASTNLLFIAAWFVEFSKVTVL